MINIDDLPIVIKVSYPIAAKIEIIDASGNMIHRIIEYNRITKEAKMYATGVDGKLLKENGKNVIETKVLEGSTIRIKITKHGR